MCVYDLAIAPGSPSTNVRVIDFFSTRHGFLGYVSFIHRTPDEGIRFVMILSRSESELFWRSHNNVEGGSRTWSLHQKKKMFVYFFESQENHITWPSFGEGGYCTKSARTFILDFPTVGLSGTRTLKSWPLSCLWPPHKNKWDHLANSNRPNVPIQTASFLTRWIRPLHHKHFL